MSEPPVDAASSADDLGSGPLSTAGPRQDALVGTTLAGRFKILEPIARGGMGTVYKAEQLALGRICAVKTMLPTFDQDISAEFHRRFFNEAAVAAKLTHPNTVTVFDYGNEGDLYFIAMEYITGKTLKQVIEEEGTLEPLRAMMIAMEIARSLREAHTLGVVHRDLKPANVVIVDNRDEHDTIKVLDFGLVKSVKGPNADTVTTGGLCVGSPSYMAPEQVDGDDVSPSTDIYSLGIVLFEMLCGRPPFVKTSKYSLVMAHLSEQPPALGDLMPNAKFPKGLDDVIARCLEKAPKDRFDDLEAFLSELQRIARGQMPLSTTMMKLRRTGSGENQKVSSSGPREIITPSETPRATTTGASVINTGEVELPVGNKGRRTVTLVGAGLAILAVGGLAAHFALGSEDAAQSATSALPVAVSVVTPPASTSEATSVASETAPVATTRKVHVETTPTGAKVQDGDKTLCEATPCEVVLPLKDGHAAHHEVKLTLAGYRVSTVKIAPSEASVKVDLSRIAVGGGQPAAPETAKPAPTGFLLSPY